MLALLCKLAEGLQDSIDFRLALGDADRALGLACKRMHMECQACTGRTVLNRMLRMLIQSASEKRN